MRKCHLELAGDKTSLLRFGRYSGSARSERPDADIPRGTFNFLGFTHYESKSRSGKFKLGRRTEKKRFARGIKRIKLWLKKSRNEMKLKDIWLRLNWRLRLPYQYYGVSENSHQLQAFYEALRRIIFKWVNRRSQKRSFNWKKFIVYLKRYPLAKPRIYHDLYRMVY